MPLLLTRMALFMTFCHVCRLFLNCQETIYQCTDVQNVQIMQQQKIYI